MNTKLCALVLTLLLLPMLSVRNAYATAETQLRLSPSTITAQTGISFDTDILVSTNTNQIVSADLIIHFNPDILEVSNISIGTFMTSASIVQKRIDNQNGSIIYSFYTTKEYAKKGQGTLAHITWKTKRSGISRVSFDQQKTLIYAIGEGNALTSSTESVYTIIASGISQPNNTPANSNTTQPSTPIQDAPLSENLPITSNTDQTMTVSTENPEEDQSVFQPFNTISRVFSSIFTPKTDPSRPQSSISYDTDPKQDQLVQSQKKSNAALYIFFIFIGLLCCVVAIMYYRSQKHKVLPNTPELGVEDKTTQRGIRGLFNTYIRNIPFFQSK